MTDNSPVTTIRDARALMPGYRLNEYMAKGIAERQATRLLQRYGITEAPVDISFIIALPRITVCIDGQLATKGISGYTQSHRGGWVITVNRTDSATRRRFTLAHEFKHVLDHPFVSVLYPGQSDENPEAETICDYFAACLLMPRTWVKRLWCGGVQDVDALAARFRVSPAAMARRLQDMRLIDQTSRHGTQAVDITRYFRRSPYAPVVSFAA